MRRDCTGDSQFSSSSNSIQMSGYFVTTRADVDIFSWIETDVRASASRLSIIQYIN